jgi:hypothetical protein
MLFLDGVYIDSRHGKQVRFRQVKAPTRDELTQLTHTIAHRIGRHLERLCRYIARPAVSNQRLSLTRNGQIRYELKTPWRINTQHGLLGLMRSVAQDGGLRGISSNVRLVIGHK